jgi:hypothetical protein
MGEQQLQDLVHVPALTARERGDQRRKAGVVAVVGIGPERQQAADEGERAVIDGVFEDDLADPVGAAAVGKVGRVAEQILSRFRAPARAAAACRRDDR